MRTRKQRKTTRRISAHDEGGFRVSVSSGQEEEEIPLAHLHLLLLIAICHLNKLDEVSSLSVISSDGY
jgi:hypothetical protein